MEKQDCLKEKIIEIFISNLLKQLHKVQYMENGYPIEAVPKATILELGALVNEELSELLHLTDISDEDITKAIPWKEESVSLYQNGKKIGFLLGAKWYRSQINNK